ncbi:MAG: branched-chain amino acid ABC transporter substrate-binding protein, partial [Nitrospinota bacterium]
MRALLVAALLLVLLPLYAVSYWVEFWYFFFLLLTLAGSYDIVGGHMGYINLGHSTFFGLGAYAFGITFFHGWGLGA